VVYLHKKKKTIINTKADNPDILENEANSFKNIKPWV
jgi:hypothetical protein